MGLLDKPTTSDGSIKELIGAFYLVGVGTREVNTKYGPNTAVDLFVDATDEQRFTRTMNYSGFSAGLVRQIGQIEDGDLPTWVCIERVDLDGGKTTTQFAAVDDPPELDSLPESDDIPF